MYASCRYGRDSSHVPYYMYSIDSSRPCRAGQASADRQRLVHAVRARPCSLTRALCTHTQRREAVPLCVWLRMPSLAGIFAIVGLAIGKVQADTMDCTSYYCGHISGSLTQLIDESDSHTLITDSCNTASPPPPSHTHTHTAPNTQTGEGGAERERRGRGGRGPPPPSPPTRHSTPPRACLQHPSGLICHADVRKRRPNSRARHVRQQL